MKKILAIDPGNIVSGFCLMDYETYKIIDCGIISNEEFKDFPITKSLRSTSCVIEGFKSYGMAIGQTTIDAIWWSGRLYEMFNWPTERINVLPRKEVKLNLCGHTNAKDANVKAALIERFASHDFKHGKGTKGNPDWFYGFKKDIWQACALGVTYIDILKGLYDVREEMR